MSSVIDNCCNCCGLLQWKQMEGNKVWQGFASFQTQSTKYRHMVYTETTGGVVTTWTADVDQYTGVLTTSPPGWTPAIPAPGQVTSETTAGDVVFTTTQAWVLSVEYSISALLADANGLVALCAPAWGHKVTKAYDEEATGHAFDGSILTNDTVLGSFPSSNTALAVLALPSGIGDINGGGVTIRKAVVKGLGPYSQTLDYSDSRTPPCTQENAHCMQFTVTAGTPSFSSAYVTSVNIVPDGICP